MLAMRPSPPTTVAAGPRDRERCGVQPVRIPQGGSGGQDTGAETTGQVQHGGVRFPGAHVQVLVYRSFPAGGEGLQGAHRLDGLVGRRQSPGFPHPYVDLGEEGFGQGCGPDGSGPHRRRVPRWRRTARRHRAGPGRVGSRRSPDQRRRARRSRGVPIRRAPRRGGGWPDRCRSCERKRWRRSGPAAR